MARYDQPWRQSFQSRLGSLDSTITMNLLGNAVQTYSRFFQLPADHSSRLQGLAQRSGPKTLSSEKGFVRRHPTASIVDMPLTNKERPPSGQEGKQYLIESQRQWTKVNMWAPICTVSSQGLSSGLEKTASIHHGKLCGRD
jgi:hypothetical protein